MGVTGGNVFACFHPLSSPSPVSGPSKSSSSSLNCIQPRVSEGERRNALRGSRGLQKRDGGPDQCVFLVWRPAHQPTPGDYPGRLPLFFKGGSFVPSFAAQPRTILSRPARIQTLTPLPALTPALLTQLHPRRDLEGGGGSSTALALLVAYPCIKKRQLDGEKVAQRFIRH